MNGQWFSPSTACTTLERVRPTVDRLREIYRAMQDARPGSCGSDSLVERGYFELLVRLHAGIGELTRVGVVVRDLAAGRIDFPSRRDGRPVLLTWRWGDAAVGQWRELEDDEAAARPVDLDGPWDPPPPAQAARAGSRGR